MGLLDLSIGTVIKAVWYNGGPPRSGIRWATDHWHVTPWWDWHRYRGGKMRAWQWSTETLGGPYDGEWTYRTFEEHARHVLLEMATGKREGSSDGGV